jgi:hypothetical protein
MQAAVLRSRGAPLSSQSSDGRQAFQKPELEEHEVMKGMKGCREAPRSPSGGPTGSSTWLKRLLVFEITHGSLIPGAFSIICFLSGASMAATPAELLHVLHHFMSFLFRPLETIRRAGT